MDGFDIINPHCKYIIVGTTTTMPSKIAGFPYMNENQVQQLWQVLDGVFGTDDFVKIAKQFKDGQQNKAVLIKNITELLEAHNCGLWDMIKSCDFKDNGKYGNNDIIKSSIIYNNLPEFLKKHKNSILIINGNGEKDYKKRINYIFNENKDLLNRVIFVNSAFGSKNWIIKNGIKIGYSLDDKISEWSLALKL